MTFWSLEVIKQINWGLEVVIKQLNTIETGTER
jgi:hypothetical protein